MKDDKFQNAQPLLNVPVCMSLILAHFSLFDFKLENPTSNTIRY